MQEWPLRSYLELRAVPTSARSARQHARNVLREWQLDDLADTVELLVSEIVTNAVRASAQMARQQQESGQPPHVPWLRFWLISDRHNVLIQVWDDDHRHPVTRHAGHDAEAGRGLLLIEALSARWGCFAPDDQEGKIVWAVCARLIQACRVCV
jgi:Histidine kinase-like ATPase domain